MNIKLFIEKFTSIKYKSSFLREIVSIVLVVIVSFSWFKIADYVSSSHENTQLYGRFIEEKISYEKLLPLKSNEQINNYTELKKNNPDFIGWINVSSTNIDYPFVQTHDNQFYITHNFLKEKAKHGAIFMDYRNDGYGLDKHTILYGHHMKDGSMFSDLIHLKDIDLMQVKPRIYTDFFDGERYQLEWEIFSLYVTSTDFYYIETNFENNSEFENFITTLKEKSQFKNDVIVTKEDQIITLSTCSYQFEDARFVVHARLVERP